MPVKEAFAAMGRAADRTRGLRNVRLNEVRGPHSSELESFIARHVYEYDLVITHNSIFRPAIVAVREAKRAGTPSILLPHLHLDDDFYHFPDVLECAREADLVLASPKAAVEFLVERGCNAEYHSPGCDTAEEFGPQDQQAFRDVYPSKEPFVLVLGRKAGAKRYPEIIKAAEELNSDRVKINVVLIGPDDDKLPIDSSCATYLGPQPRSVVRGALMSCLALCNMSVSESFGIVLLEAWLAGKPVIANKRCPAFHDLAEHGVDALMVESGHLRQALKELHGNPQLAKTLGNKGRIKCDLYDWGQIKQDFVAQCLRAISDGKETIGEFETQQTQMYETV
jgi:glycosyltransferase involved in cell wall biosynthesis